MKNAVILTNNFPNPKKFSQTASVRLHHFSYLQNKFGQCQSQTAFSSALWCVALGKYCVPKMCSKKIWGQKKFGTKKILGSKIFGAIKISGFNFGIERFQFQKEFWSQEILSSGYFKVKKCLVKKIQGSDLKETLQTQTMFYISLLF